MDPVDHYLQHTSESPDVPNFTYMFLFGVYTAFEIKAAQSYPTMSVPVLRMADTSGKTKDLFPAQAVGPGGTGNGPLLERIGAACADGRTHVPMLCKSAKYAFVVRELLRDKPPSEIIDPPLQVDTSDVYVRRTQALKFHGCSYWTSWPPGINGRDALNVILAEARTEVVQNPHLIITGMAEIAKMMGLTVQLDEAIARMIGILLSVE